jgi:LuxR family maltose regulon positive regulatory protein
MLSTKLYIPPLRPNLTPRPRLIERLNRGLRHTPGVTLVSAPAGFGKTTLVNEWLRQSDLCTAWLSLDETDNDPTRFLTYLVAALQQIGHTIGQIGQGILQTPHSAPTEALLTVLINEIAANPTPFVLVLDDYHVIKAQSIHHALTFLLEHLPPHPGPGGQCQGMHMVITCRADPPLPLARWRGRGQLTELREADLRFTTEEIALFFNEISELNLSAAQVQALENRTEGWITGLHLAALSMQGHEDLTGFINGFTGSHRYILDYLTDEVLSRQPEEVQRFLFQTSILDRLSGPLCDVVVGRGASEQESRAENDLSSPPPSPSSPRPIGSYASSQEILEYLESANLFLISLDDERRWYRYHHLFADLLRHRLRRNSPGQLPALHRRASEWYEQNGLPAEAIGHALAAADFERAATLIEQTAWEVLTRGEIAMLLSWLNRLPDELAHSRPELRIFNAWARAMTGQPDAAESYLQDIDSEDLQGEVAAVRAYVAFLQQDSRAIELSRQALEHLPEQNWFMRSIMAMSLGTAYYWALGDPVAAIQSLTEAVSLGQTAGDSYLVLMASSTLGEAQQMRGQLCQAAETYRQALQLATRSSAQGEGRGGGSGHPPPFAGLAHIGLAGLLYEWNDLDRAQRHAQEGIRLGERGQSVDVLQGGCSYLTLAQVYQARGEVDNALEMMRKAEQFAQSHNQAYVIALAAALRARLWLAQGNVTAASRWAQERGLSANDELSYARETESITLARVLLAQGQAGEALRLLARLVAAAQAAQRMGSTIKILALQALTFEAQSDVDRAVSALEQALCLAEPEGYIRTFVDEGQSMALLLQRSLSQGIVPSYASQLLLALGETSGPASPVAQPLVEPLSERELEVLRLVAAGLSNREIAEELYLSINTVKAHAKNIYSKLNVRGRMQAADRARELDLL